MSAWPSQRDRLVPWRRRLGAAAGLLPPLALFLGVTLIVRVLTDDLSAPNSRHSGSLNLSAVIALMFILLSAGLLLRRRSGLWPAILATLWLCVWTGIAVNTNGASTETLREGVREVSVVALFMIVYNARGAVTVPIAARLVQLIGCAPALVALYQLATFTGIHRPYGTFAHPDSAAMFFTIATTASLWLYLENGRRRIDALLTALFAVALIATFSIDGLATLTAMLVVLGALRPGSLRTKLGPCAVAGVIILVFFATPLGSQRVSSESSNGLTAAGEPDSSLTWRLNKWKMLVPEWERSPIIGLGIGTTTTAEGTLGNRYAKKPPHNEYIRYLVETGVIGVAILLAALTILIRNLIRMRRGPGATDIDALNASTLALAVVAGCLVNSLADNTLLNSPTCYAAALIVAAVLALPGIEVRRAPVPQTA